MDSGMIPRDQARRLEVLRVTGSRLNSDDVQPCLACRCVARVRQVLASAVYMSFDADFISVHC